MRNVRALIVGFVPGTICLPGRIRRRLSETQVQVLGVGVSELLGSYHSLAQPQNSAIWPQDPKITVHSKWKKRANHLILQPFPIWIQRWLCIWSSWRITARHTQDSNLQFVGTTKVWGAHSVMVLCLLCRLGKWCHRLHHSLSRSPLFCVQSLCTRHSIERWSKHDITPNIGRNGSNRGDKTKPKSKNRLTASELSSLYRSQIICFFGRFGANWRNRADPASRFQI